MRTLAVMLAAAMMVPAQERKSDLRKRLVDAYGRAGDWLVSQQDKSGAWKQGPPGKEMPSVAYTSLMVAAFARAPKDLRERYRKAIDAGAAFIVSKRNEDGSFGEGPTGAFLKTYTTAIALMALSAADREKYADPVRGAQAYLKQNQLKEGLDRGGSGYGDDEPSKDGMKKTIANLSTTGFTAEALHDSGLPREDQFWKLVVEFVRKCQNNTEVNTDKEFVEKLKAVGLSVGDDGGLYYSPVPDKGVHKAGTVKVIDKEVIQSYGSMTYEGIKTYLFAGLKKDSPEVKAAIDWVRKNYSVEAHPGFPYDSQKRNHLRGLFYYYLVFSRAMDAIAERPFRTFDGKEHDWPVELGEQLLKSMKDGKMWVNENAAWWENDPLLVTSYVLNTLDILLKHVE
jgi:squalene-hopene/tetraprenyl-beta-curcumene cyclase